MGNSMKFYIDGSWVDPVVPNSHNVVNPATEEVAGTISLGSAADVDKAVAAARRAFTTYSQTGKDERIALMQRIIECYSKRYDEIAETITAEMGSPLSFSREVQTQTGISHFKQAIAVLKDYPMEGVLGDNIIVREPIGVCGLITPWNWPINQIVSKIAYAFAAGCTVVLKPSEISPLSAILLTEALHEAGVPKGVFNLVNGDGPTVGQAICEHPDVDMVSFTGSTRAGILVAQAAAKTVKRVSQELGGKSANIVLPDADLKEAVSWGVGRCFTNTGQSCQAPTRMFVPRDRLDEVLGIAKATAEKAKVGDPRAPETTMGPVVSKAQFEKVQRLIEQGVAEGATLVTGGPGRPAGLNRGYYVRPTVFANVTPEMSIAREEIFGPVLSVFSYGSVDEAIEQANATVYGLAGYVHGRDPKATRDVAARLRAGRIYINGAPSNNVAPFGGFKQSGNGREHGVFGFEEFLEVKAVIGFRSA
ncbi:MAG: aldehyde dehydrogenase family protein [Hyphomicrobiaceae bacterium]